MCCCMQQWQDFDASPYSCSAAFQSAGISQEGMLSLCQTHEMPAVRQAEEGMSRASSPYIGIMRWCRHSTSCLCRKACNSRPQAAGRAAHLFLLVCKLKFLHGQLHQLLRAPAEVVVACRDVPAGRAERIGGAAALSLYLWYMLTMSRLSLRKKDELAYCCRSSWRQTGHSRWQTLKVAA